MVHSGVAVCNVSMLQAFLARTHHSRSFGGGLLVCQVQVRSSATSARQLPCIGYNRHSKHVNGLSLHSYCESAAARFCVLSAASLACLCMHKKELASSLEIIHSIGIQHWFRCLASSVTSHTRLHACWSSRSLLYTLPSKLDDHKVPLLSQVLQPAHPTNQPATSLPSTTP